jgi:hypothetical protein
MATISIDVIKMRQMQDKNGWVLMLRLNPADELGVAAICLTPAGSQFKMELSDLDENGNPPDAGAVSSPAEGAGPQPQDKPAAPASRSLGSSARGQAFSLAQRIGALCTKPIFHRFLADVHADRWNICNNGTDTDKAALIVRSLCGVKSRADIEKYPDALNNWLAVAHTFDQWQSETPF